MRKDTINDIKGIAIMFALLLLVCGIRYSIYM